MTFLSQEITQIPTGNVMVNGQWLYRPEEAMEKCGGNWLTVDSRELFYSLHLDEFPAESVMHKCIVHFVPPHKQIPSSMEHPGFVVQKVYDDINQKLWKITDKGHADGSQREIDRLIKKTQEHLGELPDRDNDLKKKSDIINKQMLQIDVSDGDNDVTRSPIQSKAKDASNLCLILKQCRVCTGDRYRDMWLEKLLQAIQFVCQLDPMLVEDSDKRKDSTRKTMTISGVISESDKMISNVDNHSLLSSLPLSLFSTLTVNLQCSCHDSPILVYDFLVINDMSHGVIENPTLEGFFLVWLFETFSSTTFSVNVWELDFCVGK